MFKGLYTALITPFDDNGEIDIDSLSQLIKMQISAAVNGIILFGTTGENATLSTNERDTIIQHTIQTVHHITTANARQYSKIHVIVGTGTNSTKTTIDNSISAEKLGADGIMVVTPYYNKPSQEGLYQHYKSLNDAVNIPIMVYNVPTRTGVNIDDTTLLRLMKLSNIYSMKDYDSLRPIRLYTNWSELNSDILITNNTPPHHTDRFIENANRNYELFKAACTSKFTILAGDDVNSLSIYTNGGHGCVSVAANILPGICQELHCAIQAGNMQHARAIHAYLHPIYNALFCETNPVPVKYAAYKMGYIKTPLVRQPLYDLLGYNKVLIENILTKYCLNKTS